MGHKCKGLILHCIDFRLGVTIKDYLDKQNLIGDIDIVSIAGGVKDLDYAMKQIEISERLHGISEIILIVGRMAAEPPLVRMKKKWKNTRSNSWRQKRR